MLNPEQKKIFITNCILTILGMLAGLLIIINWKSTPVVYFNYPNNYCVEVVSPNPDHNCENMPEKYQHEWSRRS